MELTNEFSGGPGVGEHQQVDQQNNGGEPTPPAQPKVEQPIYLGGKVFNSVAELAAYTNDLQTKVTLSEKPKTIDQGNVPDASDMIFTDPKTYTQVVKEDAVNEAIAIIDKREAVRNLWNGFYENHKDLAEHKDLVEFQYNKLKKSYGDLPADQALVKVGSEVRAMLNRVRGSYQGGKELPTEPAIVAGVSNQVAPTQAPVKQVNETFISQVRQFQRRGK